MTNPPQWEDVDSEGQNPQGEDIIDWLTEQGLCWVNSFFQVKKRGTWFNLTNKAWYELD